MDTGGMGERASPQRTRLFARTSDIRAEGRASETPEALATGESGAPEVRDPANVEQTSACGTCGNESGTDGCGVFAEDDTQLAAIRELMTRASARGVWLTLGEIAEATEFAEASISAQLRHLRKAQNGGHRVEKRHRTMPSTTARMRRIREARRGPVIWEYRVL